MFKTREVVSHTEQDIVTHRRGDQMVSTATSRQQMAMREDGNEPKYYTSIEETVVLPNAKCTYTNNHHHEKTSSLNVGLSVPGTGDLNVGHSKHQKHVHERGAELSGTVTAKALERAVGGMETFNWK
eukprot:GILJ01010602.1.p1 GENE.GILJ01010602.1~~GILJ01010602.1.p1  ORF type:complete len:127 (-),score=15.35 GILJ01010602.1:111-491(-)